MLDLFFSSKGRLGRTKFLGAFLATAIFITLMNMLLRALGNNMTSFYIALFFPFVSIYMLYCVYGKRLHDMGHSVMPFIAMIVAECVAVMVVMLSFGGAEYFSEFSQFERKEAIDPDVTKAIIAKYQAEIAANINIIRPLMMVVPILFTGWTLIKKGDADENRYGPAL